MRFIKLQLGGQDYIYFPDISSSRELPCAEQIKALCDRQKGVGASGIFAIDKNEAENARIFAFNSCGELHADLITSSFCGILGMLVDSNISHSAFSDNFDRIEAMISDFDGEKGLVSGDLGKAVFTCDKRHILSRSPLIEQPVEAGNRILRMSCCYLAGVKAVHMSQDIGSCKFEALGEKIIRHALFRKRADAVFYQKSDLHTLYVRVLKNSGSEALCDIAAASAAAACACKSGIMEFSHEIKVIMPGGSVFVMCDRDFGIMASSEAHYVFSGDTAAGLTRRI